MSHILEEGYWKVASILAMAVRERRYDAVLVSSAVRGEGTTTVTLQVASELRNRYDLRPLVVELDFWKPVLVKRFGLDPDRTLEGVLERGLCVSKAIQQEGSGISVIAAAAKPSVPQRDVTPVLTKIVTEARGEVDIILVDTPPILEHGTMLNMGSVIPRMVLVVQAGRTRYEVVHRAQRELNNANITVVGAVLNKHKRFIPDWIYRSFIK
jgi:Mrp family chromosome partitioning ATPase